MTRGWRDRLNERRPIDHWIARQREIVMRLPRWLVGSTVFGALALGIYWAVTDRGMSRWLAFLPFPQGGYRGLATIALTAWPVLIALDVVARLLRPRPPSNLPPAEALRPK